jgi:hypothetical protein
MAKHDNAHEIIVKTLIKIRYIQYLAALLTPPWVSFTNDLRAAFAPTILR